MTSWITWFIAGSIVAVLYLLRFLWNLFWDLRLGPKHDFDLENVTTRHTGVFMTLEDVQVLAGIEEVIIPTGTQVQTEEAGDEYTYPLHRCRRCRATMGLEPWQMRQLPSSLLRGCRPNG